MSVITRCGTSEKTVGGATTANIWLGEARNASQALAVISGPMPAGSPMLSANGRMRSAPNGRRASLDGVDHATRASTPVPVVGLVSGLQFDRV